MAELGEGLNGYLDVQDATLRAPRLEAVSNIGIANTAPQHAFSVGSNLYVDTESSNVLTVDGNVVCEGVKVGLIEIIPSYDLAAVSNVGNVTQSTIQFSNATTGFVTTANATIGNILTVEGNASINGNLSVTSNLEVGTANLFVDTVNSRIGVNTSIPTESLDVVGNMNLQQVSNTASIKLNSNVVTEFNRSKKLIKYPRVALTQNALNNGYTVIQSGTNSNENRKAWTLFNNDVTTSDQYHAVPQSGESNPYDASTGAYEPDAGFEDGLGDVAGEYVYVVMPDKIKLQGVSVHPRDVVLARSAESARFMGSNDGTTWVDLGGYGNYVWGSGSQEPGNFFTVDSNEYYNYIGVVWTKVKGGSGGDTVNMTEVQFFGVPEYDPEADGVDVVVKSVPNVPNTDWLEVYYDAKNYSGSGDVQDESGNDRDAEMNATFDNGEIKAFNFSGAYTSNVTTSDHGLGTGDVTYTVSYWFKRIRKRNTYDYLYIMGNGGSVGQASLMWILNEQLSLDHWSTQTRYNEPIQNNRWYHVAAGHRGGVAVTNDFLFIDGQNVGVSVSTPQTFDLQGSKLTLGTSHNSVNEFLEGSIANFRLFNRALTSDEIYQLYAYQKEYFGHGDLGMTLKAGRLGIGTSEPRAMLDVNGTLRVGHDRGASMQTSMVIADGGNVGIGTSNPTSKLHIIDDNADTKVTIRGGGTTVNDSNVTIQLLETAASFYGGMIGYSGTSANQGLRFGHYEVSSTPRIDMAIDRGTGNVGIGTTDPSHAFHVASSFCRFGNIKFNSGFSAMPSDASTGINMIGGNAGGAVLFVMTFHNGANDATATRMVLLRKRQSGTWTQSSTNTTVIAAQTATATQDGTLSFDTSNNILRYRYSTGGNSHFYVIEFDG
jgi:hypothetical protein